MQVEFSGWRAVAVLRDACRIEETPLAVVSILGHEARPIRDALCGAADLLNTLLVGDGAHLVVDDSVRCIPALRAALQTAGLSFDRLEEVEPTIEDLSVAVTSKERKPFRRHTHPLVRVRPSGQPARSGLSETFLSV